MTLQHLQQFNGSPIRITLDGTPALAILFFLSLDSVQITSLCFLKTGGRCPLVKHDLTPAEITQITPMSRNELMSEISLTSETAPPQQHRPRLQEDLAALRQRMRVAGQASRRERGRALERRQDASRTVHRSIEAQRSAKECRESSRKSRRSRTA